MDSVNARVKGYYEKIGAQGGSLDYERRCAVGYSNQGDTLLLQGSLDAARKAFASPIGDNISQVPMPPGCCQIAADES
jgi:hypothetical protein